MKKILLAAGLAVTAISATAGSLTLNSANEPNIINVYCGKTQGSEVNTGMPIPANGKRTIPYFLIKTLLGSPLTCDFYEGKRSASGTDIATASFSIISNTSAMINSYTQLAPTTEFTITGITTNTPEHNINVTLTKLS